MDAPVRGPPRRRGRQRYRRLETNAYLIRALRAAAPPAAAARAAYGVTATGIPLGWAAWVRGDTAHNPYAAPLRYMIRETVVGKAAAMDDG